MCMLRRRSCLASKSSKSICFSSSILRVWVFYFSPLRWYAPTRRTREMYNNFDNIFLNVIFGTQLVFFSLALFLSLYHSLRTYVCMNFSFFSFAYFGLAIFHASSARIFLYILYFGCAMAVGVSIYIFIYGQDAFNLWL